MDKIRWGIIGVGDVTEVKSGPGFQKANGSELVAVMRRNGEKAKDYARRHNVPKWYDDADKLINDPDVDAVYIATPPHVHLEYTLKVAKAGKPVYVEKPMARTYAECMTMLDACKTANVPLFVAYYRRALPRFVKVKELVDAGEIGDVRYISILLHWPPPKHKLTPDEAPWRLDPEIAPGGQYADLACHTLDFLDYVFGGVTAVEGRASNQGGYYDNADIVSGSWVYETGIHATGIWCFTGYREFDSVELVGTQGKITFSSFMETPVVLEKKPIKRRLLGTQEQRETFTIPHPDHVQQPLIQQVVDDLRGKGTCVSTGESAARTNWVMDQMVASSHKSV